MPDTIPQFPDWFADFIRRHTNRCHAAKWPSIVGGRPSQDWLDMFMPWVTRFAREGITQEIADRSSNEMAEHVYSAPGGRHLDEFMAKAIAVRDVLSSQGPAPTSRADAMARSRNCPECCANGWTSRKADRDGVTYSFSMFCLCPSGEWLARYYFELDRDLFFRSRRLAQYPELWDNWLSHPSWPRFPIPRDWPIEPDWIRDDRRIVPFEAIATPADLRAMVHGIGRNASSKDVRVL